MHKKEELWYTYEACSEAEQGRPAAEQNSSACSVGEAYMQLMTDSQQRSLQVMFHLL